MRIRYRSVSSDTVIGFGADAVPFSIRDIEKWKILSLVIFMNSHMTKMHDSLPPHFFAQQLSQRSSTADMDMNS
jgi:hypothetical protein